jgi:hypothetical protein
VIVDCRLMVSGSRKVLVYILNSRILKLFTGTGVLAAALLSVSLEIVLNLALALS